MDVHGILASFFTLLATLSGSQITPASNEVWTVSSAWVNHEGFGRTLEMTSTRLASLCGQSPQAYVEFPGMTKAAYEVIIDNVPVVDSGAPNFANYRSFKGTPVVKCSQFLTAKKVVFRIHGYDKTINQIKTLPQLEIGRPLNNVANEIANAVGAGALILIAFFLVALVHSATSWKLKFSLIAACFTAGAYLMLTVAGLFSIEVPLFLADKASSISVWLAVGFIYGAFVIEGMLSRRVFSFFVVSFFAYAVLILLSETPDGVALSGFLPIPAIFLCLGSLAYNAGRPVHEADRKNLFNKLSVWFLIASTIIDIMASVGITKLASFPIGFPCTLLLLAMSVNKRLTEAYKERAFLKNHFEEEVARKTTQLATSISDLKRTQADMVHKEKLAALGLLSAGLAHEITNSLNFVNAAVPPVARLIDEKFAKDDASSREIHGYLERMQKGLNLTFEIINGLKNYVSANRKGTFEVAALKGVNTSLVILRSRLSDKNISVKSQISESDSFYGDPTSINQVLMNLILNAIDASPANAEIEITGSYVDRGSSNRFYRISIKDQGTGIPSEIRERVWEPFFSTKESGVGTGLGLHIVKSEILRHMGSINFESSDLGTTFVVDLPANRETYLAKLQSIQQSEGFLTEEAA